MEMARSKRRRMVLFNYLCLIVLNVAFYFVFRNSGASHIVDALGIIALILVGVTFIGLHMKSGLWTLTHTKSDRLDERELQITHKALCKSYSWFSVICLVILLANAVLYRFIHGLEFIITVPLVVSLIYLAHTLPGSILAWTETEVPGNAS